MPDRVEPPLVDERFDPKMTTTENAFEGKVWNVRRDRFTYGDETLVREYMDHPGAVAVLALDDADRAILIQQYRHPIRTKDWELPAGLLDVTGEDPLTAAQRELAEEVDLRADHWAVLTDFCSSPGGSDEAVRVYLARGLHETDAFARTGEEADMVKRWVSLDDIVAAIQARNLQNAILVVAAQAAYISRAAGWASLGVADSPWERRSRRIRGS